MRLFFHLSIMKKFFVIFLWGVLCCSCMDTPQNKFISEVQLCAHDTIKFPIDENTFYESKVIFQFEEEGREYLFFQNIDKGIPRILLFDVEKTKLFKTIPLYYEGPNGIPAIWGGWPLNLKEFIITTSTPNFYIIDDSGNIKFKSRGLYDKRAFRSEEFFKEHGLGAFCPTWIFSYLHNPAIIKDSLFYFPQSQIGYPRKKETWAKSNMFACVNLHTGEMWPTQFCYPSIFNKDEIMRMQSYSNDHSYAYTGKDVAVSFYKSDSIYVSSDFEHVKAYEAKSNFFPHLHPEPYDARTDMDARLRRESLQPQYHSLLYDKYRRVFYRVALHPYEWPKDKSPMSGDDFGREFSIVILNEKYEVIGETRFPGHIYNYHLYFVGKKGLYLSLNNLNNPIFNEDELMFQCFTLEDIK